MGYYMSDLLYDVLWDECLSTRQVTKLLEALGLEDDPRAKYVRIYVHDRLVYGTEPKE